MCCNLEDLKAYLSEHPVISERAGIEPLMEVIYKFYMRTHKPNEGKLRECFEKIRQYTDALPFLKQDAISRTIVELAAEQEREAFLDGLQAGAQLMLELTGSVGAD